MENKSFTFTLNFGNDNEIPYRLVIAPNGHLLIEFQFVIFLGTFTNIDFNITDFIRPNSNFGNNIGFIIAIQTTELRNMIKDTKQTDEDIIRDIISRRFIDSVILTDFREIS